MREQFDIIFYKELSKIICIISSNRKILLQTPEPEETVEKIKGRLKHNGKRKASIYGFIYTCALILIFDLLGGKWKLRILWHIINGDNRFSLLLKGIPELTEKVLTTQLRELEEHKIIKRKVICEKPLNVQYALSRDYAYLEKILEDLCDFSEDYAKKNYITIHD